MTFLRCQLFWVSQFYNCGMTIIAVYMQPVTPLCNQKRKPYIYSSHLRLCSLIVRVGVIRVTI